jgi:hypothetical protein
MYAIGVDSAGLLVLNKITFSLTIAPLKALDFGFTSFETVRVRAALSEDSTSLAFCAQ